MDFKIFVHCDADVALCRRRNVDFKELLFTYKKTNISVVLRDIAERGRDYNEVLKRYNRFVRVDY
jgi:uridine kinase